MADTMELERLYQPSDEEVIDAVEEPTFPRTRPEGWLIALLFAVVYGVIGYFVVSNGHIVEFGALERLADAYMAWWNSPPKLAAIGLSVAPVGTLAFLAPALVKPLATSLVALPLVTALAGGGTVATLNTLMARCGLGRWIRWLVVLLVGLNPMMVFYAGNGSPVMIGVFLAACSLLAIISWRITDETRYLVGAGLSVGAAVMVDYTFLAWALALLLTIAFVGPGPRGGQTKLRASMLLYLTPIFYAVLIWTILNGVILNSPFRWLEIGTVQTATNLSPAFGQVSAQLGTASGDLAQVILGVAPLLFLAAPLLLISALGRRDSLGLGLVVVGVFAAGAILVTALLEDRASYVALSTGLPLVIAAVAALAWLFREESSWRFIVVLAIVGGAAGAVPLSWHAMRHYEYQEQEQAFTRYVETRESQEGTTSLGGYRVGVEPEAAMADYINNRLKPPPNSILTDSKVTYGVVLLSGRPGLFVDRADYSEGEWLTIRDHPFGKVRYMLVANSGSGDLIRKRYPGLDLGAQAGLVPIFHTERYVLVQLEPGVVPAASVSGRNRLRNQPRLITPKAPLEPPPARPAPPSEAGLSPLPEEPQAGAPAEAEESGLSSAPKVEGE
jgi:hypothetical protein